MYSGITVIKRNGRKEALDISKIRKYTMAACEGLDGVDYSELELDAKLQFRDGITTEEIQQTLIKTAVDKIDIDRPNWNFVAARLFLYDLYHKVTGFTGYNHLKEYFEKGEKEGRILPGLKEKFDLEDLNAYIKPERDLQFTYLGIKTLYDRYILKDKENNPIELPQQLFMGVAMFLAQNETNPESIPKKERDKIDLNNPKAIRGYWAKKFYDVISKFEVMVATPTLSNARTTRHQLSSCFLKGTLVKGIDKEIPIEEIKEGDFVLTHNKEFKKVTETYKREYEGDLISLKINGLLRDIKATVEHPILSIKSKDVSCKRKLSTCLFNQGNSKYCFKLEGQYKNDCEDLNKDLTKAIKWNEIKDLQIGDFVSISFSKYCHNKDEILISDFVSLKDLIFDDEYIFFKRSRCSFINDRGFVNIQIKKVKNKVKLNKEFFLLIGYYLAEGHISKNREALVFTFSSKEKHFINEVKSLIYSIFGIDAVVKENADNSTNVIVNSKIVASFIYEIVGSGFNKKRLSSILKYARPENQVEMLVGAFRGDGCAIEEGYQLTLSNKGLIEDLFEVALRCGLFPYMFKGYKNHLANYYPYYLKIGVKNDKDFVLKVNKNVEKINLNPKGNAKLRYFWLDDKYFMRIENVEKEEIKDTVYNIEVEDDHSYSVNFVDVHNCYVGSMNDNIEGIFDDFKEMALLSKYGGGIGWDVSKIRALGSFIDNHKNAAGGVIPWLKITNDVAIAVDQLGCVARNSFVKVIESVKTEKYEHKFFNRIQYSLNEPEEVFDKLVEYAKNFAFEYAHLDKETVAKIIENSIRKVPVEKTLKEFNISKDQYKKIMGKYKKIEKPLPEGFKRICNYPLYAVNKEGVVINTVTLKPLSKHIDKKGYIRVTLGKEKIALHKLLYQIFIEPYDTSKYTVDHIDGDKLNNSLSNLQLLSNEENISKGWEDEEGREKRIEKSKIKKFLAGTHKLNGDKRGWNTKIVEIKTKIIPITEVQVGDLIQSFNMQTGKVEFREVEATHDVFVEHKDQINIVYEDGGYIVTSKWHPLAVYENGKYIYKRSDEVKVGDIGVDEFGNRVKIVEIDNNPMVDENYFDLTVEGNNNYFCSTDKEENVFHLIHNTRKGAIAVYLEPWHMDIMDFLDLKKNSGEERRRAHDLFPALWIPDLFMKRVLNDELWTLFDPYETPDLTDLYGEEFEKRYVEYENDPNVTKEKIKAKELWKKILLEYYETGNPFLCFKDNANRRNQNNHSGIIRSSNLCTEIFQNTEPNHYKVKVTFEDESFKLYEEEDDVEVESGGVKVVKKAKKITSLDSIDGKQVYIVEKVASGGKTAVCNLASVNLSKVNTPEKIAEVIPTAIRMLDNVIDLNFYPVRKTKDTNLKNRAIGLGAMGEAQMLAERQINWGSDEHLRLIDKIFEGISYHAINASCDLAKEKGTYPEFKGSRWSKGILPIDTANEEAKKLVERDLFSAYQYDWEALREKVKKGIRNGYLMAVAPTSSISILTGTTQAIEPVYKRKWYEENLSGLIPVVVPNLSAETYMFYTPAYELDQRILVKAAAIRQKWIDQGQSLNIFITTDKASGRYLHEIYTLGWKLGLKSFYYLRSQSPEIKEDVMDRSIECYGCQ